MLQQDNIYLRSAKKEERDFLWQHIFIIQEWKKHDAPYFPLPYQSRFYFQRHLFKRLRHGKDARVIEYQGNIIGYLSCYWEDTTHYWLQIGITLFSSEHWGKQLGRKALALWIDHLFTHMEIQRLGLSTWSGNPRMMKCALALGMKQEACIRNVRFYDGKYFDALQYGVLREEWHEQKTKEMKYLSTA